MNSISQLGLSEVERDIPSKCINTKIIKNGKTKIICLYQCKWYHKGFLISFKRTRIWYFFRNLSTTKIKIRKKTKNLCRCQPISNLHYGIPFNSLNKGVTTRNCLKICLLKLPEFNNTHCYSFEEYFSSLPRVWMQKSSICFFIQ